MMDLRMPVMDGLDAIRHIRADAALGKVPIVALSANPSPEKEAAAIAAGADRMLSKPVDLKALNAAIADLLKAERPAADDEGPALVAPPAQVLEHLLNLARAGNLRAIRKEIPAIVAANPDVRAFTERLDTLAAAYQSPAVLRLISQHIEDKAAA
jgi:DNA-binding response OmpR family regulator